MRSLFLTDERSQACLSLKHVGLIILMSAVLLAPAFILGAGGTDLHCQSLWVTLFTNQFWHGDIYPRWLQDMFAGNGSPVFFYYPPLAYFITALFGFLQPLDAFGYYPMAASVLLAVVASGVTFYVWMRAENANSNAALLGSLLYITAPSHVAQDFYHSLLLSSVWAYVWVPLLLMFAKKIAYRQPYSVAGFAATLGLLILTNIPVTIIFSPIAVGYSFINFPKTQKLSQCVRLISAILLAIGLAAILLLPAYFYKDAANIDIQWLMTGTDTYEKSYFFMGFNQADSNLFTLYWTFSVLLLFVYFYATQNTPLRNFFGVVSILVFLLMIPVTKPLWNTLLPLKMLQMSERLFILPALALAVFAVFALPRLRLFSLALVALSVIITVVIAAESHTTMQEFKNYEPARYESYKLKIDQYSNYLTSRDLIPEFGTPEGIADVKNHLEQVTVLKGDVHVNVSQWLPRHIIFTYKTAEPSTLQIRQFAFPGWRAFEDSKELDIRRDEKTGQIQLDIPSGSGEIQVELTKLFPEIVGEFISIFCVAIIFLLVLIELQRSKRKLA